MDQIKVLFWGKMIPLQGVGYIRQAIELLRQEKNITFQIVGDPPVPYADLPGIIRTADICLGIFGDTDKTLRVIPNKVYEAIAMGKAVISADTSAIRELFTNRENILLCERANPEDLAAKIRELCHDPVLRKKIADGGHAVFQQHATPKVIANDLLSHL